jgi:hypothetical protein
MALVLIGLALRALHKSVFGIVVDAEAADRQSDALTMLPIAALFTDQQKAVIVLEAAGAIDDFIRQETVYI